MVEIRLSTSDHPVTQWLSSVTQYTTGVLVGFRSDKDAVDYSKKRGEEYTKFSKEIDPYAAIRILSTNNVND